MLKFFKEQKAAILSGLIATILFIYFLQPILGWLASTFLTIASFLSTAYVDRIYAQAAQLETVNYAYLLYGFVIISFSMSNFVIASLLLFSNNSFRWKNQMQNYLKNKFTTNLRLYKAIVGILFFTIGVLGFSVIGSNFVQLRLITSFEQHIRILAPYISEQQEREIMSKWSSMSSHEDYENLYETLNNIAQANHITLPTNKLYSATAI